MKKPLIIAVLIAGNLFAGDFALRAQNTNNTAPPPRGLRGNSDAVIQQLNLTGEQKPKFQAALNDMREQLRTLRQDSSLSMEDRRAKAQSIRQGMNEKLKALLTPDQYQKWLKLTQRGPRRGQPPAGENAGSTNAPAAPPK